MGGTVLTAFSMEDHRRPSTFLSMDSCASSSHKNLEFEMNRQVVLTRPPDINLPFSAEQSPPLVPWVHSEHCDILDVGLGTQVHETGAFLSVPKIAKKCAKRNDSIWGAWFFFSFYFKPVLNGKSKAKVIHNGDGVSGFDKSDLQLDIFMVQHDLENMYMWVFKEKPENSLGKMQLRSYMNGHSRQGDRLFPFSVDKGFVRSHKMQRKHYRGLSNPQCVHGIEVVPSPELMCLNEDDLKRWKELTGRDLNFIVPPEASDYGSWRNLVNTEFELERPLLPVKGSQNPHSKKLLNASGLNLSTQSPSPNHSNGDVIDLSPVSNKRKKDCSSPDEISDSRVQPIEPHWLNECSGVSRNAYGPVTAAKSIYEDEKSYLLVISLPFVDLPRVKVSWRNTLTQGIIKISCISTAAAPFIKRQNRTFKLMDSSSEHCPPGEFVREIPLPTRIPEDANIEAYCDGLGNGLEILVPKPREGPEEHEVRVCVRPHHGCNDLMLS